MFTGVSHFNRLVLFCLLATFITGCAKIPMPKGSSKSYTSVRFIAPNKALAGENAPAVVEANQKIHEAIAAQMREHGLRVVQEGRADLVIAYLIILQDNVSTSYSNQYFGSRDFSDIVTFAHKQGAKNTQNVQKRALVIDLIEESTGRLIYRDYALTTPLAHLPAIDQQNEINNAVAKALEQFFR